MLPLRDHNPIRTTPVINYLLIAVNVLMFLWELSLGDALEPVLGTVAFIPARFWHGMLVPELIRIFVSMFLHGGLLHIGGNMLYLWIFGDNIEDRLGHFMYLVFYLACGFLATLSHAFFNPGSMVPSITCSGAAATSPTAASSDPTTRSRRPTSSAAASPTGRSWSRATTPSGP